MLSADFGHLERDTQMIDRSAAEWVHIDVMDGVFVPNISFGFPVMKAIRKATSKLLDVHLMIVEPEKYFFLLQCLSPVLTNRYRLDGILKTIYVIRPFRLYVGTRAEICIC